MTVTSTVAQAREELREDHERLRALVERLRETEGEEALAAVLAELHSALLAHFNAEERPEASTTPSASAFPISGLRSGRSWTTTSESRRSRNPGARRPGPSGSTSTTYQAGGVARGPAPSPCSGVTGCTVRPKRPPSAGLVRVAFALRALPDSSPSVRGPSSPGRRARRRSVTVRSRAVVAATRLRERVAVGHRLAVHGRDHVPALEAGAPRPGCRRHRAHQRALALRRGPGSCASSELHALHRHAELATAAPCPSFTSCAMTFSPCVDGIAKPMPMLPPEGDTICELMPTSSPLVFTSAPPELPWLMGASVWRKSS